jgi:two-component SAPR family response regulator
MRIVIVGSDYTLLQLLRLILEDEGHELYVFLDPADAVDWLKKESKAPDLMFFEPMLPNDTGIDLPALLQESKFSSMYKILISIAQPKMVDSKFWDYFLKNPFTIKQLLEVIKESQKSDVRSRKSE